MPYRSQPTVPAHALGALERIASELVGITAQSVAEAEPASDLTLVQWRALVIVAGYEGRHIGDIAEAVGSSVPSTSRLIRRLERRGLVTTERDNADRRATIVRSTQAGAATRAQVMARRRELLADALGASMEPLPISLDAGLDAIALALERRRSGHARPGDPVDQRQPAPGTAHH
jgi:DNA-binding MarR family transcriptional regulator